MYTFWMYISDLLDQLVTLQISKADSELCGSYALLTPI